MNDFKLLAKCNRCGEELTVTKIEANTDGVWQSIDTGFCSCNRAAHRLTNALIAAYQESLKEEG